MKLQTARKNETSTDQSKMLPRLRDGAKTFRDPRFSNYLSPCSHLVVKVDRKTYCEAVTSQSKKDENITVADPDLQIKGGTRFSMPWNKGGSRSPNFFSALEASVWSKNKGARAPGPLPYIRHWIRESVSYPKEYQCIRQRRMYPSIQW